MASPEVAAPSRGMTQHAKRKASRKSRLTSESLQSLLEGGDGCGADRSGDGGLEGRGLEGRREGNRLGTARVLEGKSEGRLEGRARKNQPVSPGQSNLVRSALSSSEIDLDRLQISQQDLRILEILALRNSAEWARREEQHRLRIQWEEERRDRQARRDELEKEGRRQLTVKRRRETEDCQRRLLLARDRFLKSQVIDPEIVSLNIYQEKYLIISCPNLEINIFKSSIDPFI